MGLDEATPQNKTLGRKSPFNCELEKQYSTARGQKKFEYAGRIDVGLLETVTWVQAFLSIFSLNNASLSASLR